MQLHLRRSISMKIVPAYTIPQTGPATRAAVYRFLAAPRLLRLGVTEPDGTPLVHPVWYTRCISLSTMPGRVSLVCGEKLWQRLIPIRTGCARLCRLSAISRPGEGITQRAAF